MTRIAIFFLLTLFATSRCGSKQNERVVAEGTEDSNDYPNIILKLPTGEELQARDLGGKNVFIFFQPECDHCQQEAVAIEQRLQEFKGYTLYFITSAAMPEIVAFAQNFNLDSREDVRFAWTSTEGVLNHYGPIQTPSVYVYADKRLKASFNGQTEVENILRAL